MKRETTHGHLQFRDGHQHDAWRWAGYIDGQRTAFTVHAKGKKEAWRVVEQGKDRRLKQRPLESATWTVGQMLDAWLGDHLSHLPSVASRLRYEYAVTSIWLVSRTRATLRSAEFGFFGVVV